jgi:glycosyltransferase involved in cell wall biosynthesis
LKLLKNPTMRRKMGEAGRQIVRNEFNIQQMIKKITGIYNSV